MDLDLFYGIVKYGYIGYIVSCYRLFGNNMVTDWLQGESPRAMLLCGRAAKNGREIKDLRKRSGKAEIRKIFKLAPLLLIER